MTLNSLAFLLQKLLVSVVEVKINKKRERGGEIPCIKYMYIFNIALNTAYIFNIH